MKPVSAGMLKNGFRFYTYFDPYLHLGGVGVKVGSLHDPADMRGMAHTAEHVVCRKTHHHRGREIELKLREYGCGPRRGINIRTDYWSTFYGTEMLLRRKFMLDLFDIFAEMVRNPKITERDLRIEKAAVFNEYLHHGEDSTEDLVTRLVHGVVYERNPAHNRIDCEPSELQPMPLKRIQDFIDAYYVPNNMFAVIMGPEFRKAKEMAERYFGDLQSKPLPKFPHDLSEIRPTFSGVKSVEIESKKSSVYHVAMAFPTNPWGDDDDEAIEIISEILAFRVENTLRERNQTWGAGTYHPFVWTSRSFAHGLMYVWFETPSADFVTEGITRVIEECEKIKNGGFLESQIVHAVEKLDPDKREDRMRHLRKRGAMQFDEEFSAMKRQLQWTHHDSFRQSNGVLAERIIESACNGDETMTGLNSYLERLNGITKKGLIRVANEYLQTKNYAQVIVKPAQ